MKRNGYVYIYFSNESNSLVYFDNFKLTHTRGPLIQESHYSAWGLLLAAISSDALNFGGNENQLKYNGKEQQREEFSDGSGLEAYDFGHRMQDPQIGRMWQQDRYTDKYLSLSPYQYAANDPVLYIDVSGDSVGIDKSLNSSKEHSAAFSAFVHTKQGHRFLAQYASKGQVIFGVKFDKQGKYGKQHINVNYSVGNEKEKSLTTPTLNKQGGIDINVSLSQEGIAGTSSKVYNLADAIIHESFIHVDMHTNDWLDDHKLNFSNISEYSKQANSSSLYTWYNQYQHTEVSKQFYQNPNGNPDGLWPSQALQALQQISSQQGLNMSTNQIKNKMWDFDGSDIHIDSKTGKATWH